MAVLIAGCGYVGSALAERLLLSGETVVGMRRRPASLPPGVDLLVADLEDENLGRRLQELAALRPLSSVVFAASAGAHSPAAYEAVYVRGMRNLVQALAGLETRPKRLIFVSSTSVYGDASGAEVTEASATVPDTFAGKCMLEGECIAQSSGVESVALRFGGIYGPDRWRLPQSVLRGEARLIPGGGPVTNRIHRDDGAAAIQHVLSLPNPAPAYLVVDDGPAPHNDVLAWLARRAGRELEWATGEEARSSRGPRGSKRCSNALLRASGFRCAFPTFREGYEEFFSQGA